MSLPGLDNWIEGTPPDPGRGNGSASVYKLTCRDCDFRDTFANACAHHELTGHTLLGRLGVPQVLPVTYQPQRKRA